LAPGFSLIALFLSGLPIQLRSIITCTESVTPCGYGIARCWPTNVAGGGALRLWEITDEPQLPPGVYWGPQRRAQKHLFWGRLSERIPTFWNQ